MRSRTADSRTNASVAGLTAVIVSILLLTAVSPRPALAAQPSFPTTSLVSSKAAQSTQLGVPGVAITYNSSLSSSESIVVIGSVLNSAGQTVSLSGWVSSIAPGSSATFFVGLPTSLHGSYTVVIFVTTMDSVPLSASTSVSVTV